MDFNKYVFLGINKDGELIGLELSFHNLNKGTKWENDHYYLSTHGFSSIVDEDKGEEEAFDRLSESEYWEDLGYLSDNIPEVLKSNIDFKEVAQDVINSDGWEMTNGEHYEFETYQDKNYFLNLQFIGCEEENNKPENYKYQFVNNDDFKFLIDFKDVKPEDKDSLKRFEEIQKKQNRQDIVKAMLE